MVIQELLAIAVKNNASDLHVVVNEMPQIRVDGALIQITNYKPFTKEETELMLFSLLTPEQKELLLTNKELDFSLSFGDENHPENGRFRINLYFQKGNLAADFRFFPLSIKTLEELHLPVVCRSFAGLKQGFVLVTGPTGHGKSTTLASMINEINLSRAEHILTIEDPIEYIYPKGKSLISQREMGVDTHSWSNALRAALREDPNVVLVGEMRDPETIAAAITIAETGHLVFSTIHTGSAAESINRIVDAFPSYQQNQIRAQLASTLRGIISQRLIPQINGGRIVATEILVGTPAISSNIREGKTHLIDSVIQTSAEVGMMTLNASLASLVLSGSVALDVARTYSLHEAELLRMVT